MQTINFIKLKKNNLSKNTVPVSPAGTIHTTNTARLIKTAGHSFNIDSKTSLSKTDSRVKGVL
jgi:hypothetical protein